MTQSTETRRCRWCRRVFTAPDGPGRPREFCKRSCRQRDYEARRRAGERGLDETELVVARSELDELRDRIYVLECALEDVTRDLSGSPDAGEVREALDWLVQAARPVVEHG
ncbi:MAG TPA: hypothetical protein VF441_05430 [Acidimicrobiia bacterium]